MAHTALSRHGPSGWRRAGSGWWGKAIADASRWADGVEELVSALGLHLAELQRVTALLEDALHDQQRAAIAVALSDLAVRLELDRITLLGDPETSDPPPAE